MSQGNIKITYCYKQRYQQRDATKIEIVIASMSRYSSLSTL